MKILMTVSVLNGSFFLFVILFYCQIAIGSRNIMGIFMKRDMKINWETSIS